MLTAILFLAILTLLVLVHEWGHFVTARKFGMKVYEFGFGFPPRAFGFYRDPNTKKWIFVWRKKQSAINNQQSTLTNTVGGGEHDEEYPGVLYTINWLPLGGFVKIKGENGELMNDADSFGFHKAWKKVVVLVAGVGMNFVLAVVLLAVGFLIGLPTDMTHGIDDKAIIVEPSVVMIQQVVKDSPAFRAGLSVGDKIISLNDTPIQTTDALISSIQSTGATLIRLAITRDGNNMTVEITPEVDTETGNAHIGVYPANAGIVRYPWYLALWKGFVASVFGVVSIVIGFFVLIKGLILGNGLSFEVSGPVGIATMIGQSARLGVAYLLNISAMISLSLAVINILPIPALDGGRLLFVLIEWFTGRKVPIKYEQIAHTIGFVLLMILIVVVTWRDVVGLL